MKTKNNIIIFTYLFILVLLSIIFYIIMKSNLHDNIISFDYKIFNIFSKISNKNLTIFFRTITEFGNIFIPVTILLLLIVFIKKSIL